MEIQGAFTITERSGVTLANFQVKISLNASFNWSAVNPDASDIRFTTSDGFTQLNYWIEDWDYINKEATIWVKIPQLPANSQVTIYMYYGNPSATGIGWHTTSSGGWYAGDGDAVFDFFDDFEGSSLNTSKWVINAANYLVSNGVLRINVGAVRTNDLFNLNSNYILEGRIEYLNYWWSYSGTLTAVGPGFCSGYTCSGNSGSDATVLYMRNYASGSVYTWIGSGAASWYDAGISYVFYSLNNVWYILGEKLYPSGVTLTKDRTDVRSYSFSWSKNPTKITLGAFHGVSTYNIQDTAYD